MQIVFNGERVELKDATSLKKFLEDRGIPCDGTAAACDEEIVPKSQWDSFLLKDGVKLDVFNLVAGG